MLGNVAAAPRRGGRGRRRPGAMVGHPRRPHPGILAALPGHAGRRCRCRPGAEPSDRQPAREVAVPNGSHGHRIRRPVRRPDVGLRAGRTHPVLAGGCPADAVPPGARAQQLGGLGHRPASRTARSDRPVHRGPRAATRHVDGRGSPHRRDRPRSRSAARADLGPLVLDDARLVAVSPFESPTESKCSVARIGRRSRSTGPRRRWPGSGPDDLRRR